jgi:hypothetical protein
MDAGEWPEWFAAEPETEDGGRGIEVKTVMAISKDYHAV